METRKKVAAGVVVGGGLGVLLGWFLHRPKKAVAGAVQLSNLAIDPPFVPPGEIVTIRVDALNTGVAAVTVDIVLHIANQVDPQAVTLEPGESRTLQWQYTAEDISGPSEVRAVIVAVGPLVGSFSIVTPM